LFSVLRLKATEFFVPNSQELTRFGGGFFLTDT
jgi:hypothetical protein